MYNIILILNGKCTEKMVSLNDLKLALFSTTLVLLARTQLREREAGKLTLPYHVTVPQRAA